MGETEAFSKHEKYKADAPVQKYGEDIT